MPLSTPSRRTPRRRNAGRQRSQCTGPGEESRSREERMIKTAGDILQMSKRGEFCKGCHNELSLDTSQQRKIIRKKQMSTKREDEWGKKEL